MSAPTSAPSAPPLKDLTIENITANVQIINSACPNPRLRHLLSALVAHLHDYAREVRLSTTEWLTALRFLATTGQTCTDVRQEFILLSDILGLSLLVDSIDHPTPPGATSATVLGPFHTDDATHVDQGGAISHDPDGDPMLVVCAVADLAGAPLPGVSVDVWETDSRGFYDVQYAGRAAPDGRAVLTSDANGRCWFRGIVPVPYPIPSDGPVGKLLALLGRHCYRPAHVHFLLKKEGFEDLVTALYVRGDPYETSDAVFGVKESLVVDIGTVGEEEVREYGVKEGTRLLKYSFVLVSVEETRKLRDAQAMQAMEKLGLRMKLVEGLPVPDVD